MGAIPAFYESQRKSYAKALEALGLKVCIVNGGFYHWLKLPGDLTAKELNDRLFKNNASILPGSKCDMMRLGSKSHLSQFCRFSFGRLKPEQYNFDVLKNALSK